MVLSKVQCRGALLIWIIAGQGPTALAVGAGGGCLGVSFSRLSFLFSFSLSLGWDGVGPLWTEILSQRAFKPKTTNQKMQPILLSKEYGEMITCHIKDQIIKQAAASGKIPLKF